MSEGRGGWGPRDGPSSPEDLVHEASMLVSAVEELFDNREERVVVTVLAHLTAKWLALQSGPQRVRSLTTFMATVLRACEGRGEESRDG